MSATSCYNELEIVLTVLRQSIATIVYSIVAIFEYCATLPQSTAKANTITPVNGSQAATQMRTIQGLLLYANHSSESYLLPIAPLFLEAMQRMGSHSKQYDLSLSNKTLYPNEYLISCYIAIIHLIEEKHWFNVQFATAACPDDSNIATEKLQSSTASQFLDTLEWFVHRDSFNVLDLQQAVGDISFVLNQVTSHLLFSC